MHHGQHLPLTEWPSKLAKAAQRSTTGVQLLEQRFLQHRYNKQQQQQQQQLSPADGDTIASRQLTSSTGQR
jgi:hypothetical protein